MTNSKPQSSLSWVPLVLLALAGCATTSSGRKDLLAFLARDPVTRQEVRAHLGEPNASFEKDRVLTYRLKSDKGGFSLHRNDPGATGWEDVNYDLVLVFDENGLLQRHNLVAVRSP
jgi:hypothetical protein